jgi:chemotaxis protein CheZ
MAGNEAALPADLEARIEALVKRHDGLNPNDIVEIVESIMTSAQGDLSPVNLKLYAEIEALSRYIKAARAEIASLRPGEITDEHLPAAGEELEAIVGATEQATETIMEAAEGIEQEAQSLPAEQAQKFSDAVTRIYEACGFQDITGQRITKVVTTLKHIERKVHMLLDAFDNGDGPPAPDRKPASRESEAGRRPDEELMNGPQAPENAISQEDIDALLASFD